MRSTRCDTFSITFAPTPRVRIVVASIGTDNSGAMMRNKDGAILTSLQGSGGSADASAGKCTSGGTRTRARCGRTDFGAVAQRFADQARSRAGLVSAGAVRGSACDGCDGRIGSKCVVSRARGISAAAAAVARQRHPGAGRTGGIPRKSPANQAGSQTYPGTGARVAPQGHYQAVFTQFSSSSPGTRSNSATLLVTSTKPSLRACPAMCRSFTPMGWPSFSRAARMAP
jgi:hypothetical protein